MNDHSNGIVVRAAGSVLEQADLRGKHIVVGLSGGADSVVLLHVLKRLSADLGLHLDALHVHHGISPNADRWSQFCVQLCGDLDIACRVVRVDLTRRQELGLEAAAREARYAVYRLETADAIALAHHQDDQAETLLLQLLRGAGVRGLSAMPKLRALDDGGRLLVRPLLEVARAQILEYAKSNGLSWIEDESNLDLSLDRNFLRARVIPVLAERFTSINATLQRAAQNAGDAAQLLDELAQLDAHDAMHESSLQVSALENLSAARARNLLRWFFEREGYTLPPRDQLEEALRQILHARRDARLEVHVGNARLHRHRGRVYIEREQASAPGEWIREWSGQTRIELPHGLGALQFDPAIGAGLSLERLRGDALVIRPRKGGERLRLAQGRPSRTLKNLLQEAAVPQWRRDRLPLLFRARELIWVPGVGADYRYAAQPGEAGVLPQWILPR